jgi:hypothetical protein
MAAALHKKTKGDINKVVDNDESDKSFVGEKVVKDDSDKVLNQLISQQ